MENRAQFLQQDKITKNDIITKVLAPHNYDGLRAYNDLEALMYEERRRTFAKSLLLFSVGGTVFSFFNVLRFSRLSPSGRTASVAGLTFFSLLTYSTISVGHFFNHQSEESQEKKQDQK